LTIQGEFADALDYIDILSTTFTLVPSNNPSQLSQDE
jgi:hypothetical protein